MHPPDGGKYLQTTKEELERYLAEGLSLEQIGKRVGKHASTVSHHLKKHGLVPTGRAKHAARGPISEMKLRTLAAEGISVREIVRRLDRSPSTVWHWLRRYEIEHYGIKGNREKALAARASGETVIELRCRHHGLTDFYVGPDGAYKCKLCRKQRVAEWRRNAKDRLIKDAGGRCVLCGYNRCPGALHFHHLDPRAKEFGLAMRGHTKAYERLLAEAKKCLLLCANCHAEVERGVTEIPDRLVREAWRQGDNLNGRAA